MSDWAQTFWLSTAKKLSEVCTTAIISLALALTLRGQDIYRHSKNLQKHPNYSVMSHKIPSTLSLHEEPMHAHKKRLIGKTLAPSSIQHFESVILEQVHKFCSCLSLAGRDNLPAGKREEPTSQWTIPRNMAQWCKHHVVQC